MKYITVTQASKLWGLSARTIRLYCNKNTITGVIRNGKKYMIPDNALKPVDKRKLRYKQISDNLAPLLTEIDKKVNTLNMLYPGTKFNTNHLYEDFISNFIYNSNALDGIPFTLRETTMVLNGRVVDKKALKYHLEVVGHRDALIYIEKLVLQKAKLRETDIKELHALLLIDDPFHKGIYRSTTVNNNAHTEYIQPALISSKITELLLLNNERRTSMHNIERIVRFHLELNRIYPFIEGNGRIGRLIVNLELMRAGYPAIDIKYADCKQYNDAFKAFYCNGNADNMIIFISKYINQSLDKYIKMHRVNQ